MCCLYGVLDYGRTLDSRALSYATSVMGELCEVRGTDAAGVAYLHRGKLVVYKRPVPAHKLTVHLPEGCHVIMGHTRMTTQGSERFNRNNHPFTGRAGGISFALAHNGIINNDYRLRTSENLPSTNIQTDSYVAVQLLEQRETLGFDSLRYMAEKVSGSFAFTVLDSGGNLYFVRGQNPLCIYRFPELGFCLYASTREILNMVVSRLGLDEEETREIENRDGDILRIDTDGSESRDRFSIEDDQTFECYYTPGHVYRVLDQKEYLDGLLYGGNVVGGE